MIGYFLFYIFLFLWLFNVDAQKDCVYVLLSLFIVYVFISTINMENFEISFDDLSNIAILSFKNGYRLHIDSVKLFNLDSYPSATMLSILAMEEFGKYFSLSSYVFYSSVNGTRNKGEEEKYLKMLYLHPFKQKACFGRDGFEPSSLLYNYVTSRKFEDLKQKSLYVGLVRNNGKIDYNSPISNPFTIKKEDAYNQISLLNKLLINVVELNVKGIISYDEDEINKFLSEELLKSLNHIQEKIDLTQI